LQQNSEHFGKSYIVCAHHWVIHPQCLYISQHQTRADMLPTHHRLHSSLNRAFTAAAHMAAAGNVRYVCLESCEYAGRRQFVACSFDDIFSIWSTTPGAHRCMYEIVPAAAPCHLFMDLEYCKFLNPDIDPAAMTDVITATCEQLLGSMLPSPPPAEAYQWVELDASSAAKFSRHLTLQVDGWYFQDILHCGSFVKDRLMPALASHQATSAIHMEGDNFCTVPVVDISIYNINRQFRMYGSSKYRDPLRPLVLSKRFGLGYTLATSPTTAADAVTVEEAILHSSLVVASPQQVAVGNPLPSSAPANSIKRYFFAAPAHAAATAAPAAVAAAAAAAADSQPDAATGRPHSVAQALLSHRAPVSSMAVSPFPLLDQYVQHELCFGAKTYSVKVPAADSLDNAVLRFHSYSRTCRIKGAEHKSNHTIVCVDCRHMAWWQVRCKSTSAAVCACVLGHHGIMRLLRMCLPQALQALGRLRLCSMAILVREHALLLLLHASTRCCRRASVCATASGNRQ
jgi:hypothetical protein